MVPRSRVNLHTHPWGCRYSHGHFYVDDDVDFYVDDDVDFYVDDDVDSDVDDDVDFYVDDDVDSCLNALLAPAECLIVCAVMSYRSQSELSLGCVYSSLVLFEYNALN